MMQVTAKSRNVRDLLEAAESYAWLKEGRGRRLPDVALGAIVHVRGIVSASESRDQLELDGDSLSQVYELSERWQRSQPSRKKSVFCIHMIASYIAAAPVAFFAICALPIAPLIVPFAFASLAVHCATLPWQGKYPMPGWDVVDPLWLWISIILSVNYLLCLAPASGLYQCYRYSEIRTLPLALSALALVVIFLWPMLYRW